MNKKYTLNTNQPAGGNIGPVYVPLSNAELASVQSWITKTCIKHQRMPRGTRTCDRLRESLKLHENQHLVDSTLLSPQVHEAHSKNLLKRMLRRFGGALPSKKTEMANALKFGSSSAGYFESLPEQQLRKRLRLVTVIHAVTALDEDAAMAMCQELQREITRNVKKVPGASFYGALEPEITNIGQLRKIREFCIAALEKTRTTDEDGVIANEQQIDAKRKEYRKLGSIEILSSHLEDKDINGKCGQFLIHIHGILHVQNPGDADKLFNIFKANPCWSKDSRQVQFKELTKVREGKFKSVRHNLKDICFYITKASKIMVSGRGYLRYNMDLPDGYMMAFNTSTYLSMNGGKNGGLVLDGQPQYTDTPSLSHHEINTLTVLVDRLMHQHKHGTGYIVSVSGKS